METRHSEAWASLLTRAQVLAIALLTMERLSFKYFFVHRFTDQIGTLTLNLAPKGTISDTL